MTTVIKEIEGKQITLNEVSLVDRFWRVFFIISGALILLTSFIVVIKLRDSISTSLIGNAYLIFMIALGSVTITEGILPLFIIPNYPGYEVRSSTIDATIIIKKTTPEADQIAICKAAKELEPDRMEVQEVQVNDRR